MGELTKLLTCLDQLAVAKEQLELGNPESGRMAHILSDNAVELMLHHQAECTVASHGMFLKRERFTKQEEAQLLGEHLEPKLALARELGVLTNEQSEFVQINHRYRNEVYHRGLSREKVIWDIGWHYHTFACELAQRLNTGFGMGYSPDRTTPVRLASFGQTHGELMKRNHKVTEIIGKHLEVKAVTPRNTLGFVLGDAITSEVRRLDEILEWFSKNHPQKRTRGECILEVQLWAAMFNPERRKKCSFDPAKDTLLKQARANGITDPIEQLKLFVTPPIRRDPLKSWLSRASLVAPETSVTKALKKYDSLKLAMEDFSEDLKQQAGSLSEHIEAQVDEMRERQLSRKSQH